MHKVLLATVSLMALQGSLARADEALDKLAKDPKQWVMQQGDDANTRFSKLSQINASNVKKLQVAWTFSTGVLRGHEGGPLVVGDVMYVHAPFPNTVFALDLSHEGKILWKYEPRQDPNVIPIMCCDTVNRGVAYADGKIFLHQADTTLVALDAKTGEKVWSVMDGEAGKGQSGTDAPFVYKDKVLIGVSGGEFGVRGWVSAYNIKDGKLAWRGYSEGPDADTLIDPAKTTSLGKPVGPDSSTSTWEGDQWKIGGGATWGWYSYDPELNLVYYGSGNPSTWNPVQRPGDNRWSMSIWARDLDTGKVKWIYQMTPHDEWDFDGVNEMILSDQNIDGKARKLLTHFDRNGFGYTLDRGTGELLVAEKYDPVVNWATKVDMDKSSKTYGRPLVVDAYSTSMAARTTTRRASARRRSAPRTSSRRPTARRPRCSTSRPTTSAWTMSPTRSPIPPARPMSVPRWRCIRPRAIPTWAISSPGTARPARSCGPTRSSSRPGAARWPPPATWCSTARWKAI